jgi:hypothetical protein
MNRILATTIISLLTLAGCSGESDKSKELTAAQESNREKFILDWNRLLNKKASITSDTIVVYVKNNTNPFRNKDDFAGEYHPKLVNGQSCKSIGIEYIQVRSIISDDLLSGIKCQD